MRVNTYFPIPKRVERRLAIVDVTVVPMDRNALLPHRTVVIEDGRIKAIDLAGNITANTDDMLVVDGRGKYLLPGLADMHVHYWMPGDAALFLAHGVTLVRNMSGTLVAGGSKSHSSALEDDWHLA